MEQRDFFENVSQVPMPGEGELWKFWKLSIYISNTTMQIWAKNS
jgi:hypothetical protein